MSRPDPAERFLQVHAALHPERDSILNLQRAGVPIHRILSLYPFDLTEWLETLFETVTPGGWDTIRVTVSAGKISNGWLDSVQQLNRTLTSTLYGDWEIFATSSQGKRLSDVIEDTLSDNYQYKELVSRNVSVVLFETITVASRWNQLPKMHEWKETEDILIAVLDTLFNAHLEGSIVLAALASASAAQSRVSND